jgi:hypothetical protein
LVDLNGDDQIDILSGSYSRMGQPMAGLFQVLWGQPDGSFKEAEPLADPEGEPLVIPAGADAQQQGGVSLETICTRPTAVDWDGDGDLDLVVGNFGGTFYVFAGEGKGSFLPEPTQLTTDGQPLAIAGHHSDPFLVDWDGDGDLDLLSGSSQGGVQWAENVAASGNPPELTSFEPLIPAGSGIDYGQLLEEKDLTGPTSSTRIWVDDVNGDGKLDVLVGDSVTLTSPAKGLTVEEYQARHAAWQEKLQAASQRMAAAMQAQPPGGGDDAQDESEGVGGWFRSLFGGDSEQSEKSELEQAQQEMSELYQQQSEFMTSDMTGYVWLYLQK